jgi:hypothetical protein
VKQLKLCILKKSNRLNGIDAVFEEQYRQIKLGVYSSDAVVQVFIETAFRARRAAHIKGLSDAHDVSRGFIKDEIQEAKMDKSSVQKIKINQIMMSLNDDFKVPKPKSIKDIVSKSLTPNRAEFGSLSMNAD